MTEMDVANQADLLEQLEVPVHGREVHLRDPVRDAAGDLFRDEGRVRHEERLEDEPACGRHA